MSFVVELHPSGHRFQVETGKPFSKPPCGPDGRPRSDAPTGAAEIAGRGSSAGRSIGSASTTTSSRRPRSRPDMHCSARSLPATIWWWSPPRRRASTTSPRSGCARGSRASSRPPTTTQWCISRSSGTRAALPVRPARHGAIRRRPAPRDVARKLPLRRGEPQDPCTARRRGRVCGLRVRRAPARRPGHRRGADRTLRARRRLPARSSLPRLRYRLRTGREPDRARDQPGARSADPAGTVAPGADPPYRHNYCRAWADALDDFQYRVVEITNGGESWDALAARVLHAVPVPGPDSGGSDAMDAYVAGPTGFADACRHRLLKHGFPQDRVKTDSLDRPAPA